MSKPTKPLLLMLFPLSTLLGCLGLVGLIPSTSPELKTTALEEVSKDVDTYFDENKKLYTNAKQTIEALSAAQGTFKLSAQDYQTMVGAIVGGESYNAPKHLSPEQSTALLSTVAEATALQAALTDSAAKTKEAAAFLSSKTASLESELVKLRGNYEMIQRNPLASRRDKGKAANQIRKANKLGTAMKQKAIEHHKELLKLQKNALTAFQGWSVNLKGLGKDDVKKATMSGLKEKGQSTLAEHTQAVEAKAMGAAEAGLKNVEAGLQNVNVDLEMDSKLIDDTRSTLQGAGPQVDDAATQLDSKVQNVKKDAQVRSKSLQKSAQKKIRETKSSIQESASEAIESGDEDSEEQ